MGLKPGQKAPASGQYGVVGPRGGKIDHEVTVVKGEPMPPTKKPGQTYVMNDPHEKQVWPSLKLNTSNQLSHLVRGWLCSFNGHRTGFCKAASLE